MLTCFDALLAAYAGIGIDNVCVLVEGQVYFSKHLFGTSLDAFPASMAFTRVELYMFGRLWLSEPFAPTTAVR